jgi:LysM repeat protein
LPKTILYKPFFKKGAVIFIIILCVFFSTGPAHAGFLSDIVKFFAGESAGAEETPVFSSLSLPLLGAKTLPPPEGEGAAAFKENLPLTATQDSALIASKNPLGTLPPPDSSPDQIVAYTVQEGDTPSVIAERFGISLNTLLWANNIRKSSVVKVGDELIILPITGVRYEVGKGDTLESIAKKFRADKADIASYNGLLLDGPLSPGEIIIIPDGEVAADVSLPSQTTRHVPSASRSSFLSGLRDLKGYFMRPLFGAWRSRGIHGYNGVDFASPCGTAVVASAEGRIIVARSSGWNGGYGKYIVLAHSNGTQTLYAHLQGILASLGQTIAQGSQIGFVGTSGNSTGCHLHFEVRGAKNPF